MTTTIVLADNEHALRRALATVRGALRLLVLAEDEAAARGRGEALARGAEELPRGELVCARREEFRRRYIAFMASLNEANHSPLWWAMPFTSKNPLATPLCRSVFTTLLVAEVARADERPLVVLTDDLDMAAQLRAWGAAAGVTVVDRVRQRCAWWRRGVRRASPALFALTAAPIVRRWWQGRHLRGAIGRPRVVLTTLVHAHSFMADGGYRDVYFGRLATWLGGQGTPGMLLALLIERPGERLLPRLRRAGLAWPVLPVEGALSFRELLRCVAHAAARWLRPFAVQGDTRIDGVDVRCLVERAVRAACRDGGVLDHLRLYYAGRAVARLTRAERWIYPYENRAFEKMLLSGVREAEPAARLIGYNHASITLSHTNFVLGPGEAKITPLPDTILTLGRVVKDWLETRGHYPPGMLRVACALRQVPPAGVAPRPRGPVRDVLLTLATSVTEYVRTLVLLEAALAGTSYRLRIRPHPTIPLAAGLARAPLSRPDFFVADDGALAASLARADVVLYASSTVGLEALARGIPAVYLDLEDMLDTDPMLGWSRFKWTARRPEEVVAALQAIEGLGAGEYGERQRDGMAYAAQYLEPVSEDALRQFLAA